MDKRTDDGVGNGRVHGQNPCRRGAGHGLKQQPTERKTEKSSDCGTFFEKGLAIRRKMWYTIPVRTMVRAKTERYRSGYNGPDSKSCTHLSSCATENRRKALILLGFRSVDDFSNHRI